MNIKIKKLRNDALLPVKKTEDAIGYDLAVPCDICIERLRELGIKPYVMPYRDFENKRTPSQYEKDLAQYVNKPMIFKTCSFADFSPRKGFKCSAYLQKAL